MILVIALLSREIFDTQFENAVLGYPPWLTGGTKISQQKSTNHHWLSRLHIPHPPTHPLTTQPRESIKLVQNSCIQLSKVLQTDVFILYRQCTNVDVINFQNMILCDTGLRVVARWPLERVLKLSHSCLVKIPSTPLKMKKRFLLKCVLRNFESFSQATFSTSTIHIVVWCSKLYDMIVIYSIVI